MKLFSLALLLVLAVAVSAQDSPVTDYHYQDGSCSRNNDNCNWIIGHWSGFVTSHSTSLRFFDLPDRGYPLANTPWAQELDDLWCTSRPYEIPYECTFGYSEEDDHLYQYCWFESVSVSICADDYDYIQEDGSDSTFDYDSFATPAFFMTNRIDSLQGGIQYHNLETDVSGCLPYDIASKDLIIGNLYDGFSDLNQCNGKSDDQYGPSPVLPASCEHFSVSTSTPSTTTTTTTPTTTTTTKTTTTTQTTSTTSTPPTTTTAAPTTKTTTVTNPPTTTTTKLTGTTTHPTNPAGDYGCSYIYDGQNAVYGFELARVRPATFPHNSIDYSNSKCTGSKDNDCECVRSSSDCNWLVGRWGGKLFAKGYNSWYNSGVSHSDYEPTYPFPEEEQYVRCQWSETVTEFECAYYFNEESGNLNSHCWYQPTTGYGDVSNSNPFTTFAWEQWTEVSSLNNGFVVSTTSASFISDDTCIPFDRFDSDTFLMQFPDNFSDNPSCGTDNNNSPNTLFNCIDGDSSVSGNNNMFSLNYRAIDASWHDWDASSSLSPLVALSLLLAALLALF